jgi:hypothetical protein
VCFFRPALDGGNAAIAMNHLKRLGAMASPATPEETLEEVSDFLCVLGGVGCCEHVAHTLHAHTPKH